MFFQKILNGFETKKQDPITVAAVVGAAASVYGTVQSTSAQKKSAKLQKQQQALTAQRARVKTVREARIKRAAIASQAGAGGALQTSSFLGGTGALASQAGSQLGFIDQNVSLAGAIGSAESKVQTGQAIAGFGASIFSGSGGFKTIFK